MAVHAPHPTIAFRPSGAGEARTALTMSYELHGYQRDFLATLVSARGLGDRAAALESIVGQALASAVTQAAIFDVMHCIHCGSVNPAEWIATRKGDKEAVPLALSARAAAFLQEPSLVKVARVGEPPKKQVVPGPRTSDAGKAARCCVDWCDTWRPAQSGLVLLPSLPLSLWFLFLSCLTCQFGCSLTWILLLWWHLPHSNTQGDQRVRGHCHRQTWGQARSSSSASGWG